MVAAGPAGPRQTAGCRAPSAADGQGPAPRRGGRPVAVLHVEDLPAGDGEGHPEGGGRPCADPRLRRHGRYRAGDAPAPGAGEPDGGLVGVVHGRRRSPRGSSSTSRIATPRSRPTRWGCGRSTSGSFTACCRSRTTPEPCSRRSCRTTRARRSSSWSSCGCGARMALRRPTRCASPSSWTSRCCSHGRRPGRHGRADAASPGTHGAAERRRPGAAVHRRAAPCPHGPLHDPGDSG